MYLWPLKTHVWWSDFTTPLLNWNLWMWYRKVGGEEEFAASLLLWCCHSYMVSPFSCLGNGQEVNVTAEVLPSFPKPLPGCRLCGWVTPAQTSSLAATVHCCCLSKAQASLVGEKREGHQLATATDCVTRLQLCWLWAYLINQLRKVKIRQKLQTSGWSGRCVLIQMKATVLQQISSQEKDFCFPEGWSDLPHCPET